MRVHVAPSVLKRFQEAKPSGWQLAVSELVRDIRAWKVIGLTGKVSTVTSLAFGRDRSNNLDDFAYAWHAHLEPTDKADRKAWTAAPKEPTFDRTSDRIMVYSLDEDSPQYGCLILGIFGDPGGHRIWESAYAQIRPKWELAAQKHQTTGWVPANTKTF